jgi:hypothetical protein
MWTFDEAQLDGINDSEERVDSNRKLILKDEPLMAKK